MDKLIDYVKGSPSNYEPQQINIVSSSKIPVESKDSQPKNEEPTAHVETPWVASSSTKLEPFYVSLFISSIFICCILIANDNYNHITNIKKT